MQIEKYIDHTMLKADATAETIRRYCEEAKEHGFASVCVNTFRVPLVTECLKGSGVKVCCVVGFPLGAMSTEGKVAETLQAVRDGAREIDMVINIGAMKDGDYDFVRRDIAAVRKAAGDGQILKVIIETCLLTNEEKKKACELAMEAKADYVKTSTGFSTGGATVEDIRLMKETVGDRARVKASGGIRTYEDALALMEAGADRIGAGNGVVLLKP